MLFVVMVSKALSLLLHLYSGTAKQLSSALKGEGKNDDREAN